MPKSNEQRKNRLEQSIQQGYLAYASVNKIEPDDDEKSLAIFRAGFMFASQRMTAGYRELSDHELIAEYTKRIIGPRPAKPDQA